MQFKGSPTPSVGMEFELQLLDPCTLDLIEGILPLMAQCSPSPWIQPEYNQATVEIKSKVCANIQELSAHLYLVLNTLYSHCGSLGIGLCGSGLHPFCTRPIPITPTSRFLGQKQRAGYLSQWITFALHIHVGMPTGDAAIATMGRLKSYLPILLALSANSPLWRGYDTGFASFRQRLLASRRSYGIPPSFETWQQFVSFFTQAQDAGIFSIIRDIHWDIRPQPDLGTLEVRVMDAPSTLRDALMLATFAHVLIVHLHQCCLTGETKDLLSPQHWWFERENYFQASRLGLTAPYVDNSSGRCRSLKDLAIDVLAMIHPTAVQLNEGEELSLLRDKLEQEPSYAHQRRLLQEMGSQKALVKALLDSLQADQLDTSRLVMPTLML
jgi:carboxylate-amine ligase